MKNLIQYGRRGVGILLAGMVSSTALLADDIDVFSGLPSTNDRPNVLIIWDNSANWSASISAPNCFYRDGGVSTGVGPTEQAKKMGIEKCALYNLIDALPTQADGSALFNIGLMLFNESPAANSGGYPRKAFTALTATNKAAFKTMIKNLDLTADKSNNAAFAKSMYEAYLYFKGGTPYRGTAGTKYDTSAVSAGNYVSPAAAACGRNFLIFLANGGPGENTDAEAKALLAGVGGNTTQIVYPTSFIKNSDQGNWADEYARFMLGADVSSKDGQQIINTSAVAVTGASSDGNYPNFIQAIAKEGKGTYASANNADTLLETLLDIFNKINAVNTVFASASLPISVNAQGTYLNQVFMGMFRPDADAKPRWNGNLKQYRFALDPILGTLDLVDKNGNPAVNAATGFVSPSAVSYWTTSSSFWVNTPSGTPASTSDSPDGEVVEKGGAGQRLREAYLTSQTNRTVFTCISCLNGTTLGADGTTKFDTANSLVTTTNLGVATSTDRDTLINWVRGTDNKAGDEAGPGSPTTVRPSIHGDVLHSRPLAIDFGGTTGVVVFYGANDGMLHAINGNQTGTNAGQAYWSFIPEEVLPKLNRLRANDPLVRYATTPDASSATQRDYFVDGPVTVYQKFNTSGGVEKVHVYMGLRRGGRALYAFDVTTPSTPKLLWKKTSADLSALGQTWSEARVARVKGHTNPVIVMGGGYDAAAEDVEPAGTPTMGHRVYVLDAFDGTLLKEFTGIDRPVAASVSLVDVDFDGSIDRGYTGDLGGNIYRIDFEKGVSSSVADWSLTKLASLGSSGGKKIFYAPDAVVTKDYTAVFAGTGNREKPLTTATTDYFYTVIDRNTGKGMPVGFTPITFTDLVPHASFTSATTQAGCYIALNTAGEKVVNAPITAGGLTFFGTNTPTPPAANSCTTNLGIAKAYQVPLLCKNPSAGEFTGGGLPPSPVVGVVEVSYTNPATGETETRKVPFIIGGGGGAGTSASPLAPSRIRPTIPPRRTREYWFTESER